MTRTLRLLPVCALLLALLAPAAAEARSCKSGSETVTRLSATGVSCSVAKRVARTHARRDCGRTCRFKASRRSWSCRKRGSTVRCSARGRRKVSWRQAGTGEDPGGSPPGSQPPGGGGGAPGATAPPSSTQGFTRDDAGFTQALTGNRLHKYEEGNTGFGDYAYNFFAGGSFGYCSTYTINGQSAQGHQGGSWQVVEGYSNPSVAGHYGGVVQLTLTDGSAYRIAMEVLGGQALVEAGNASNTFAEGNFSRTENGATGC